MKRIIIIAGPNGAGKTTFATEFLPLEAACPEYVNADLIAAGLSPFDPESVAIPAGRIMLNRMRALADSGRNFALETTLSSRFYMRLIPAWQKSGYVVQLHFLRLPHPELAIKRVARRVQLGGHDIPATTIRRRFKRGLRNLEGYLSIVDQWAIYDSSGKTPVLLDNGGGAPPSRIMEDPSRYQIPEKPKAPELLRRTPEIIGAEAALVRASARAIAECLAAGLEPVLADPDDESPPSDRKDEA